MAHPLDRVLGSVVIDKLEADYQRVSSAKYFAALRRISRSSRNFAFSFVSLADPFGIIRHLGFLMYGFNTGTFAHAVLLDPRMQRGTGDTELCSYCVQREVLVVLIESHSIASELFGIPRHDGRLPFSPVRLGWISDVHQTEVWSNL